MKKLTEKQEQAIGNILSTFNFEKVYRVMSDFGMRYFDSPNTPSVIRLQETARSCMERVLLEEKIEASSCGGFTAEYLKGEGSLELRFALESQTEYVEK